ncbi:MAG: helix-turn-helix transcriptional regulator [Planctomycetes bacterium]|nr:helix-turn-helix transcriptional regulator [Planctomycetota bacterium]
MDIKTAFGERVRELRKRSGLTQAELAGRCGSHVEMQRIGEIERGERNCTLETVEAVAKGLGCEPAELFLFRPQKLGRRLSQMDARLIDSWKTADIDTIRKITRILSELL